MSGYRNCVCVCVCMLRFIDLRDPSILGLCNATHSTQLYGKCAAVIRLGRRKKGDKEKERERENNSIRIYNCLAVRKCYSNLIFTANKISMRNWLSIVSTNTRTNGV